MIEASALLRSYVRVLRQVSGASCVSLFVPASPTGSAPAMLLHDGDDPLPELRDLETAIDFQERPESHGVRASADPSGALVPLPVAQQEWARPEPAPGRRRTDPLSEEPDGPPAAWLGLRFPAGRPAADHLPPRGFPLEGTAEQKAAWWWRWLLALGGELAGHAVQVSAVLRDPITGVPGRAAFQGVLAEEIEKARARNRPLALLLVNPDDFAAINQRFGRERGDDIIRELVARLRSALRSADLVAKYGGVVYGAVLLDTPIEVAREVAAKVLHALGETAYQEGAAPLRFSIGVAAFAPEDEEVRQPLDLIRRADQALNAAKRAGGGKVALWEARWHGEGVGHLDRLTGIFTGNMASDYRNMVLLWDAVSVMAASGDFETIAGHVVEKLYSAFEPEQVALLVREGGGSRLVAGLGRDPSGLQGPRRLPELAVGEKQKAFLAVAARDSRRSTSVFVGTTPSSDESYGYYVPLVAREEPLGGLYLDGPAPLDSADLIFLEALAAQLAVALDRARTAEDERARHRQEQTRLKAELDGLREALQRAKLEYRSPQMEDVLSLARRVAPTEATVLIMGESGTGKELLARTVHELSPRRHKSLVVVDCSAIAPGLADNELFGHERGAYTGAQEGRQGRLAEANGGTLLLDEIGELPLEVQAKLLRFVQEKQLTTVGGSRLRGLDVRIIAATNRELDREVAEGRFRGDLYHRLNVVKLLVPPLRDRPEDILYLARHFLSTYAAVYRKRVRRLAAESEALLLAHPWPGNVRELQNRVMQAVILCEGDELGPAELGLPDRAAGGVDAAAGHDATVTAPEGGADAWERVRVRVARQIDQALAGPTPRPWPLGRWLAADAALEAARAADGVSRRAAVLLGVPETTFRRLHRRASEEADTGLATRPAAWDEVRRELQALVAEANPAGDDRLQRLEDLVLKEVLQKTSEPGLAAALLGVSVPTLRQRIEASRHPPSAR